MKLKAQLSQLRFHELVDLLSEEIENNAQLRTALEKCEVVLLSAPEMPLRLVRDLDIEDLQEEVKQALATRREAGVNASQPAAEEE